MPSSNWLTIALNFAIVLALLGGVLYVLKRMQSGNLLGNAQRKMRIIEAISVAPRQRIVLLRVKDQDILVGVSPQQINHLASFPLTAEEVVSESTPNASGAEGANSLTPLARRLSEMLKAAQNKDQA